MPTVIAIDCSLSMSRPVQSVMKDIDGKSSQKHLAVQLCQNLLNYLSLKIKLEYTALLSFSSTCECLSGFTRDYDHLKLCLNEIEVKDKACLDPLLQEIQNLVLHEYGSMVPCHIILITDGRLHWSADLKTIPESTTSSTGQNLALHFKNSVHFLSVVSKHELEKTGRDDLLKLIIKANNGKGTINTLELSHHNNNPEVALIKLTEKFTEQNLKIFSGTLLCGRMKNEIVLFPCPEPEEIASDNPEKKLITVNRELHIIGFLNISDMKSPPAVSRHLILPIENDQVSLNEKNIYTPELGNRPSFITALHGSLKVENKVALVSVGEDWFGIVGTWNDHKKKSNLILSLFSLGTFSVPWLGLIDKLGPLEGAPPPISEKKGYFGNLTQSSETKSYAQNLVVWTKPTGLQTDVQKLLRSAKKLPEKTQVFYKDLNRLRKAALAFGFHELLDGVASILERECTMLPGTSHPEAALQLSHAAQELRNAKGYDVSIMPLKTDFKYHSRS